MSLRARVALVTALTTLAVLVLAGGTLIALVARDERRALDDDLDAQARVLAQRAGALSVQARRGLIDEIPIDRLAPNLNLVGRYLIDGEEAIEVGDFPDVEARASLGHSTVSHDGTEWRILTMDATELRRGPGGATGFDSQDTPEGVARIEVAIPTTALHTRLSDITRRILLVGGIAVIVAGAGGWFLATAALRPLARLRRDAEQVTDTGDLERRVPEDQGLREVDELGHSLNLMLGRLGTATAGTEAALEASRSFAGNAAHELRTPLTSMQANLDVLERNPDLPAADRAAVVADIQAQQERILHLLGALRLLARGDLTTAPSSTEVDLAALLDQSVVQARKRHPDATYTLEITGESHLLDGWAEGLRVLVDNLLDNAAVHGSATGHGAEVTVELVDRGPVLELAVSDRGPGIVAGEREAVLGRFVRGTGAAGGGSGLGLALVSQQASLQGGSVRIDDADGGGAQVSVELHRLPGAHRD